MATNIQNRTSKLIQSSTEKINKAFEGVMRLVKRSDGISDCSTNDLESIQRADEFLALLHSYNERMAAAKNNKERSDICREVVEKLRSNECAI